jgi:hypothetical protein
VSGGQPRRLEQEQQPHELHGFSTIVARGWRGIVPALAEEGENKAKLFHYAPLADLLLRFGGDQAEEARMRRE